MSKRSLFTNITPIPKGVTREAAVQWLHNHEQMIKLNPLVIRLEKSTPPDEAPRDERDCAWYEITDQINYLPGGLVKGEVTYKACFHNLDNGLQTHVYAPAGLDLQEKWSIGGNEPGEPREALELGLNAPREGLYIREDVNMRCNVLLTAFVKGNLNRSHKVVTEKIAEMAGTRSARRSGESVMDTQNPSPESHSSDSTPCYCVGQHSTSCPQHEMPQRPRPIQPASSDHPDDKPLPSLPESSGLHSHWHHIDISAVDGAGCKTIDTNRRRSKSDTPAFSDLPRQLLPGRNSYEQSPRRSSPPIARKPVGSGSGSRSYTPISATLPGRRPSASPQSSTDSRSGTPAWHSGLH